MRMDIDLNELEEESSRLAGTCDWDGWDEHFFELGQALENLKNKRTDNELEEAETYIRAGESIINETRTSGTVDQIKNVPHKIQEKLSAESQNSETDITLQVLSQETIDCLKTCSNHSNDSISERFERSGRSISKRFF